MPNGEKCRFCGSPTIPKGKKIFMGREVNMVGCDTCGIVSMVATRDLPLLDDVFECNVKNRSCSNSF